jgi:endonuclease YncB( thermonuclease family)
MGRFATSLRKPLIFATCLVLGGGGFIVTWAKWNKPRVPTREYFTVEQVTGNVLTLSNGNYVALYGSDIPRIGETNYRKYMEDNLRNKILGKVIAVEVVLKKRTASDIEYPQVDVVNVHYDENGKSIQLNKELLREGMAFFSWVMRPGWEEYAELERQAKEKRLGVWREKENLEVLYVTRPNWRILHFPECPEVIAIEPKDRVEYYTEWAVIPGGRLLGTLRCKYCAAIAKERAVKAKNREETKSL